MEAAAERACRAVGYLNAGTFEFLLGPDGTFSFIELNARLQVEHPVTELCTGIDLVRGQLEVAAGSPLAVTGRAPRRGHAIEIRLNAEDPARDFMPAPGTVSVFRPPLGPGVRVDTFVEDGTDDPAVLRLADREAGRVGRRPAGGDRARGARARRSSTSRAVPTRESSRWRSCGARSSRSGSYSTSTLGELLDGDGVSHRRDDRRRHGDRAGARPLGIAVRAAEGVERDPRAAPAGGSTSTRGWCGFRWRPGAASRIVELAERAQEDVAEALRTMCGLDARVDVAVGELA